MRNVLYTGVRGYAKAITHPILGIEKSNIVTDRVPPGRHDVQIDQQGTSPGYPTGYPTVISIGHP